MTRGRQRWVAAALAAVALALAATLVPRPAEAVIVERIVAVVGDRGVLLSELRERGHPFLVQIHRRVPAGAQRAAAESQMYEDLLEKMIEEELIARASEKSNIVVTSDEIDRAFENLAAQQNMTVGELFDQAKTQSGLGEQDYRDEIRRQIVEGKMLQLRVKGRIRITEEELRSAFERAKREEMSYRDYRAAWIKLELPANATPQQVSARFDFANELVRQANDPSQPAFADLAKQHSQHQATRDKGGYIGILAPQKSPQAQMRKRPALDTKLERVVEALRPGETGEPVRLGDEIIIMHLVDRQPSRYNSFEDARNEMVQHVQTQKIQQAKEKWLEELRRRTHVDVRL